VEWRKRKKHSTLLVGVNVGACSRELLTWVLMKVARAGDHVIVVHVVTTSAALIYREKLAVDYLASPFDVNVLDVYESFCRLKQVSLQVKVSYGCPVRKVLSEEAKLYKATKLIVGKSNQHALGSSNSLASYCAKRLPCTCSVLVVDNGNVVFEKVGTQSLTGTTDAMLGTLSSSQRSTRGIFPNDDLEERCCIAESDDAAENLSDATMTSTPSYCLDRQAIVPMKMDSFNLCLPLKSACTVYKCKTRSHHVDDNGDFEDDTTNSESHFSYDSFRTVSSTSCQISEKGDDTGISSDKPKEIQYATSREVSQREESPPGWPLLKSAITVSKIPSPRSAAREMSVVEWTLQLPNRRSLILEDFPEKTNISQEEYNNMSKIEALNQIILTQENSTESRPTSTQDDYSRDEEHSLIQRLRHACKNKTCREFTYQELKSATSGFVAENLIGKGGWSKVYRGVLPDGQFVAVKSLNSSEEAEQELILEVEITATLQHKHIVSLIGYCVEEKKYFLVYNLLLRGSLEETLYGGKDKPPVHWKDRRKVAIGIAEALNYLHDGCSHPIIHRDVKSSNILLSEDFEPQLSDFGLAKRASTTSAYITCSDVVGTFGYLAPEYFMYGKVNEKTDVYSFGVVLLELITGRKPINGSNPKGQESLVMWARPLLAAGSVQELADPLLGDAYDKSEMKRMVIGAAFCLRQASQFRPRMSRILKLLRGEGDDLPYWTKRQLSMSKDIDELVEDEYGANSGSCDIQTHLSLAMLGVDDDVVSNSSPDQSVELVHETRTLQDYFYGRYSRSASFD